MGMQIFIDNTRKLSLQDIVGMFPDSQAVDEIKRLQVRVEAAYNFTDDVFVDSPQAQQFKDAGHQHLCENCVNKSFCKYRQLFTFRCSEYRDIPPGPVATPMRRNHPEMVA